jgi:hypothetical protein
MSKPKLPSRSSEIWEGGFVLEQPRDVQGIHAAGGLVVAGGAELYLLKPADETWKMRPLLEGMGAVYAVAAEPRGARRYAVVSEQMLTLFFKNKQGDQILRLTPKGPGARVSQLAWGGVKGPCALWLLHDDGSLLRMKPDLSDLEELDIEEMAAIAADDSGVVALMARSSDNPRVYVTRDGSAMSFRHVTEELPDDASIEIAVADTAVALVIDQKRVLLSRSVEDPFQPVEALASPEGRGWKTGPVVFQGATSDAALLCARWEDDMVRVMRVDPSGAAMSIIEMGGSEELDPPEVASLTWDASRQTLWGASPNVGIFKSMAPSVKGKKKPVLS